MQTFDNQRDIDVEDSGESAAISGDNKQLTRYIIFSTIAHAVVWALLLIIQSSGSGIYNSQIVNVNIEEIKDTGTKQETARHGVITEDTETTEDKLPDPPGKEEKPFQSESADQEKTTQDSTPNISNSISFGAFASFGDGLSLKDELRPYFLDMLERANRAWNIESRGKKLWRGAMLLISIEKNGRVMDVKLLQSSGNSHDDKLLVSALKNGDYAPLPDTYSKETFEAPIKFNPPLSLLTLDSFFSKPPPH